MKFAAVLLLLSALPLVSAQRRLPKDKKGAVSHVIIALESKKHLSTVARLTYVGTPGYISLSSSLTTYYPTDNSHSA